MAITYDPTAEVFELWADEAGGQYLGAFDTRAEALSYFDRWRRG